MKIDKIARRIRHRYVVYGLILATGLFLGRLIFGGAPHHQQEVVEHLHEEGSEEHSGEIYTCAMHPQIRQNQPGDCPLCGMDLIPLQMSGSGDSAIPPEAIQFSEEAIALANIQTTRVSKQNPEKVLRLYGTIQVDERLSQSQTAHVGGRIESLHINFTGETVTQGDPLATLYSPELMSAQQELLEAARMQTVQPALLEAAREKLRLWKISDAQIAAIEQSGKVSSTVEIRANAAGIVVEKRVNQGDYVMPGSVLFTLANLSQVWALFDAYESDLPFLKVGNRVDFTLQALPGKTFSGRIAFIDPMLDKTTRTAKVRVETANPGLQLKPEMYANAVITAPLPSFTHQIVIPKSALLWTGKRSIVYVKQPDTTTPAFMLHEIELGPSLGDSYVVLSGLQEGDEVVTQGTFIVDASAQLEGKRSMMNRTPSLPVAGHAQHGEAQNGKAHEQLMARSTHAMLGVKGLCDMCKERIETTAKGVQGVTSAVWDKATATLHLDFDSTQTTLDAISKAIAAVGHDTDRDKADQAVYDALPGCCKYRE